jgi:hypothetical protein
MQFLRHGRSVDLRRNGLDTFCVLVARAGGFVEKEDLTEAIWPDTTAEENNLAHLDWSDDSTLPGVKLLARRDHPAQLLLIGETADLTEDTERVVATVQTSES